MGLNLPTCWRIGPVDDLTLVSRRDRVQHDVSFDCAPGEASVRANENRKMKQDSAVRCEAASPIRDRK